MKEVRSDIPKVVRFGEGVVDELEVDQEAHRKDCKEEPHPLTLLALSNAIILLILFCLACSTALYPALAQLR